MKFLALTLALAIGCFTATTARSQTQPGVTPSSETPAAPRTAPLGHHWRVVASPYTYHYNPSDDHTSVYMLGVERQRADGLVLGGSWFRNSFGQPSAYLYAGWRFENFTPYEPLFAQVTAGLLYGYKEPFENKVPFNYNGFSPGAVLSVGWQFNRMYSAQLNFLGNAGLMFQFSVDFR